MQKTLLIPGAACLAALTSVAQAEPLGDSRPGLSGAPAARCG
ncbi:MAG: hypothetical protein ACK41U_08030 [Paracoccus sp. (in: a-proteobacteria)]